MVETSAHESFWGKLVAGEGSFRALRGLFLIIFLCGTAFFGWSFMRVVELSVEEEVFVDPPAPQSREDAKRLDALLESYRGTVEARQGSKAVVASVTEKHRRPFAVSKRSAKGAAAGSAGDIPLVEPLVEESLPPIMFVRAIMTTGSEAIAIMDINGVGNGIIVKAGYSFLEKKGRIVKITPEKVTVRWAGKNVDITPGF